MFNRSQRRRNDRDAQRDVFKHLDGQHEFRCDVAPVGNDSQMHGTQGSGNLIDGDGSVELNTGTQAQALGQRNEFFPVITGSDDMKLQTGDTAVEVRDGPNGQVDTQPLGQ